MKKLFFYSFLFFALNLNATHMISGQIAIQYVSNVGSTYTYKAGVTVFRDCTIGQAEFDDPLELGIFKLSNNGLINQLSLTPQIKQKISTASNSNLCIEIGYYQAVFTVTEDFYISNSRCCRSNDVLNVDPSMGVSIYSEVRLDSTFAYIGQPLYNKPVFVASGMQTTFNISSPDSLADSSVYIITSPIQGGDLNNPKPTPFPKPYSINPYKQGFSTFNPLGTGNSVSIDRKTGILTLMVATNGIYAIGITVNKYRHGIIEYKQVRDLTIYSCNGCVAAQVENNEKSAPSIKIAPNPAFDLLHVKLEGMSPNEQFEFIIFNTAGQLMKHEFMAHSDIIKIDDLTSGIYTIEMKTGDKIFHSRFVKN